MLDVDAARKLERALAGEGLPTRVVAGEDGLLAAAAISGADTVLAAIVGAAGLRQRSPPHARASAFCSRTRKRW
jgi:1-deoxy-D-xylulose-5-phosphate reductoisomerase